MAQPPLLENGGEWTPLATNPQFASTRAQSVGQFWARLKIHTGGKML